MKTAHSVKSTRILKRQEKIKDLKTNNKNADNLLGLPVISQNKKFCIPKKGFDNFF